MRLKLLEIQGFKSFPDKTKLTFNQDITAVIGPNGSGKSNISDAIRWVLGEQSNKQLRGQKMEDVVFSGTAKRKALGFAEVSIMFDNADRGLNFDSDEVSVTRRYYRSGESEYKINGAGVRLKDVHELFMDTGLGRDGYSMIGQGRIDEIVASKSDERRDIFEEAAGISRYRYKKAEAQRRLDRAEENMLRLRDIADELESRVGPLKTQSEKAQEFLEISVEKRELEIGLWLNTIEKSKQNLREFEEKLTIANAQRDSLERELSNIEAQTEINSRDLQSIAVQIDAIRRKNSENDEKTSQTKSEIAVLENTITHNNETIERIKRDIESANQSDEAIERDIDEKKKRIDEIRSSLEEKQREHEQKSAFLASLSDDSGDYSKQLEEKNRLMNELSASISESRVKAVTAQSSLDELNERLKNYDENHRILSENLQAAQTELSNLDDDMKRCETKIEECGNIIGGYRIKLNSREVKCNEKRELCDKLKLDIGETQRRIRILQDLERNMEGFSYAVKAVTKESEHGALRGIHGPVSRLITAPNEYSTAIEIALGAAAQNIVVSNEDDAKRAINFLKKSNGGRATFLPLTSVRQNYLRENGVEDCIGFVGIASKLVSFDSKYDNIISSLLARTVIAEDMDSAVGIARKFNYRFKIVTLDGQVVNAGGSLTGGSHAKNAGILSRSSQIEKLDEKLKKLNAQYEKEQTELKAISEETAKLKADLQNAASEQTVANEDKIRVQGEIRLLNEQRTTAENGLNTLEKQKSQADERIAEYSAAVKKAQDDETRAKDTLQSIEKDIESLSGGRDSLIARRNELSEQISAVMLEIIGYTKDIENINDSIEQLKSSKNDRSRRNEILNGEIADIEQKNSEIEIQISELKMLEKGLLDLNSDANSQIENLSKKRDELEKQSYQSRALEREKLDEREKISGEIARLTERSETMEADYNNIIAKLYDEYELTLSAAQEIGVIPNDVSAANKRLNDLKRRIRTLGSVNVAAIEEYKEVSQRYEFMKSQLEDIEKSKRELSKLITDLTSTMEDMFTTQFDIIAQNFTEVFIELFGGGTAQLKLTDPDNVLETGIDIIVQPPGKKIAVIEQLSGGEKALIALSIYFAIMKVNAPPFCLLDEVEAALDDVNVDRFAAYLRKMSNQTQFIAITHRRGTMEEADVLYGVTMQEKGVSKLLSIDVSEIEKTLNTRVAK